MNVFDLRDQLISNYSAYISSFIQIRDQRIRSYVDEQLNSGLLWPDALLQLNPAFEPGHWVDELVDEGILHKTCREIFRRKDDKDVGGSRFRFHKHQEDAIRIAQGGKNYVLTTGTGSGKSLSYIVPIVDYVLKNGSGRGVQAIIVYPMNALANSQLGELKKFLSLGSPDGKSPVTFARYTGQESDDEKKRVMSNPPDILLTNYVMLELILTRPDERKTLVNAAQGLRFLVLDELHTYRGRQGADVAMLVRRVRNLLNTTTLQCVGTSATLSSAGGIEQQRKDVAEVASKLFGDKVLPEHIIGETLRRSTIAIDLNDTAVIESLRSYVVSTEQIPVSFETFSKNPLASWIETMLGLAVDPITRSLVRAIPRSLQGADGAAKKLGEVTGLSEEQCFLAIVKTLMVGYDIRQPETNMPVFAFRLHQFISRGDTVYASLEAEAERYLTVNGQKFVPNDRESVLLPLVFCRECGQAYYVARKFKDSESGLDTFTAREFEDRADDESSEVGYLYFSDDDPWLTEKINEKVPEEWLEEKKGELRVRTNQKKNIPETYQINTLGQVTSSGISVQFISGKFRFCLHCGVSYNPRQSSEYAKLTQLSSGGRSTDTTILSLSLIRNLRNDLSLMQKARKLLSFTDNRQDASLQAGHFNDFVEIALLRAALFRTVQQAGATGIRHDILPLKVFDALDLDVKLYATDPDVRFAQKAETERALREVLGYRIYRDLKRGWRITSPNLEQCGLLEIRYTSLDEVCAAEDIWQNAHPALVGASPETRYQISKVLLDFMRRELAIKVDYLNPPYHESLKQMSSQRLKAPWGLDELEHMEHGAILFPRSRQAQSNDEYFGNVFLSARGGYGQFLRRRKNFPNYVSNISTTETQEIIQQILEALRVGGLVEIVQEAKQPDEVPGYQIPASALIWTAGDGSRVFHDPIRVPRQSEGGGHTNQYFVDFYKTVASDMHGLEAHEHTAQVPSNIRQDREDAFRDGKLPILYCSPTMELGVDISELNAVNMRNVPPTPANYAQRSGRAGRSGQPALVFTYCTMGSPHDQYYFKRPKLMVAGAVKPPRLDMTNQDLVRAHVHSIWLAESGLSLQRSLKDLLDLSGDEPTLKPLDNVQDALNSDGIRKKAYQRARSVFMSIEAELQKVEWYSDDWLEGVLNHIPLAFDQACERWRSLYRAAKGQQKAQQKIINDVSRPARDRDHAKRLRQEAESQIELLTDTENLAQSDFYSYRYLASEGFLPGYSFPRLPLSAFIPGRRMRGDRDEFLSRSRFLAISEFGPRSIIYHEGSRYEINKVNLPVAENGEGIATSRAKQCPVCGYFHPISSGDGPDRCERCNAMLATALTPLFRLQNVSTKRRDRISSDEEERMRQGFELRTALRFQETQTGDISAQSAKLIKSGEQLASLTYADAASLWRINLGWKRRANHEQFGFMLDMERGYWSKENKDDNEPDDPMSARVMRVIPFVEDTKNSLLFEPAKQLTPGQMASLQAALKAAIQVRYQLEDNELSAEPLPSASERKMILFYESAEGGAGVLRRLLEDPLAFADVVQLALQLCHFDPQTGEDLRRADGTTEDCEAACYNCLMSYYNQMEHRLLDRQTIKEVLTELSGTTAEISPSALSRAEHLKRLRNLCQSDLEREWLDFLEQHNLNLPSHAQKLIENCHTRPDFQYEKDCAAIYVDGPHHQYPERQARDAAQAECMEDIGYSVIRFGLLDDWEQVVKKYPHIFGAQQ